MRSNYKRLGPYIQEVNIRNKDLKVELLLGVSVKKIFIPSIANTVGTNFEKYKIVKNKQFTYIADTSRRGDKIGLAMLEEYDEALVSQAYTVFEIIDKDLLDPEYLMMWFRRPEFDRYARYHSHGSVREIFGWDEMCDVELPIPSIEKQREIVAEYNTVQNRIQLNEQLIQKLEETAQTIYRRWFVEFEFPIDKELAIEMGDASLEGKPFRTSGGKMVWSEELEKDVPEGWVLISIKEFTKEMKSGGTPSRGNDEYWNKKEIPWLKTGEIENNIIIKCEEYISELGFKNSSAKLFPLNTVVMAMYGATAAQIAFLKFETTSNQACCGMICENYNEAAYLYYNLLYNQKEIANMAHGGAQPNLSKAVIENLKILKPQDNLLMDHSFTHIIERKENLTREIDYLDSLSSLLLSKMTKVEKPLKMKQYEN